MHQAVLRQAIDPDQVSFVHAVEAIRDAVPEFQMVADSQQPALYERMLDDIASKWLSTRRTRSNPREVKRKISKNCSFLYIKKYPLIYTEHNGLTKVRLALIRVD